MLSGQNEGWGWWAGPDVLRQVGGWSTPEMEEDDEWSFFRKLKKLKVGPFFFNLKKNLLFFTADSLGGQKPPETIPFVKRRRKRTQELKTTA